MRHIRTKVAKAKPSLFLAILYHMTTIALILIGVVFFMLISQKTQAADIDCSKDIDQIDKMACVDQQKLNKPDPQKDKDHTKEVDSYESNPYKIPSPVPATPSAD